MWTVEIESDIEMTLSMAPSAAIRVYEGSVAENIFNQMASDKTRLCNQLSSSFGEQTSSTIVHIVSEILPAQGQTLIMGTGDWGAYPNGLGNMVGDEVNYITFVGGTVMDATTHAETVWTNGGGGVLSGHPRYPGGPIADVVSIPSYQNALPNGANGSYRNIPDVAAQAQSDVSEYVMAPSTTSLGTGAGETCTPAAYTGFVHVGGTSLSGPMWAGFTAVANQVSANNGLGPVGFLNPVLYKIGRTSGVYASSFHDIGSDPNAGGIDLFSCDGNGCSSDSHNFGSVCNDLGNGYSAAPGYDLATGLGTPKCGLVKQLASLSAVPSIAVAAGDGHSCAIRGGGADTVLCWGSNADGQLGIGTTTDSTWPVQVSGLTGATNITAGNAHTCALLAGGSVVCWGYNCNGELGNGAPGSSSIPVTVSGLSNVTAISAKNEHTCAILNDSTARCWGWNHSGELGDGTTTSQGSPVTVVGLSNVTAIDSGYSHTCALLTNQTVKCWGSNSNGQLGNGTTNDSLQPVVVSGISNALAIASGGWHSCALLSDKTVKCWGWNGNGQLGNNSTTDSWTPTSVANLTNVSAIAAGLDHNCSITGGTVQCWGLDAHGQLGNDMAGVYLTHPVAAMGISSVTAISLAAQSSCALGGNNNIGAVSCWGSNNYGQLGDGSTNDRWIPGTVNF
jgi:alpha-tubulin suppressor-like RCC1 family protein